jgi:hypothetical protein
MPKPRKRRNRRTNQNNHNFGNFNVIYAAVLSLFCAEKKASKKYSKIAKTLFSSASFFPLYTRMRALQQKKKKETKNIEVQADQNTLQRAHARIQRGYLSFT